MTPLFAMVLLLPGCLTSSGLTLSRLGLEAEPASRVVEFCCDPQAPAPPDGYLAGSVRLRDSPASRGLLGDVAVAPFGVDPSIRLELRPGSPTKIRQGTSDEVVYDVYVTQCFEGTRKFSLEAGVAGGGSSSKALAEFQVTRACPPPGTGGVPTDIAVIAPEAITRFLRALTAQEDDVFVAGSNGWALVDASSGATVQDKGLQVGGAKYAAAEVADVATGTISVCAVGPGGGTLTQWIPAQQQFGFTLLFDSGSNLTDISAFPDGQGAVLVNFTSGQISFLAFDAMNSLFAVRGSPEVIMSFAYNGASGNAVSAFTDGPDSRVYFVTDGQPGQLWKHEDADRPLGAATLIGSVGNAPRRVRVLGNLIVVSNFDDDTLSVARVDTLALVGTVPVGDGPVGIDLKDLGGGQIGVASTGLNDHTWSITVLSAADGSVASNDKHDLPAGCRAPGHVLWHKDGVLVSCRDTDNLFFATVP